MTGSVDDAARTRRTTYIVLAVVFLLLTGVAVLAFSSARSNAQAQEKAIQFSAELTARGVRTPSTEQLVRVFGDDGGATCADPAGALKRGALLGQLTNGAAGPGIRPIIADNKMVQGQLLVMKVYCPQHLEEFAAFVDALEYADVAGE